MLLQLLPWILTTVVLLALWAAIVWRRRARRRRRAQRLPQDWALSARPVFSRDERRVYRQLREALPHHLILAKLPLVRLCQPIDPGSVRYWYNLLGATHVTFAICSTHGRVLAAVDLDSERANNPRTRKIKQSVLAACKVRYLHCKIEYLPSVPELRALVPEDLLAPAAPALAERPQQWKPTRPFGGPGADDPEDDHDDDFYPPGGGIVVDDPPPLRH